VPRGRRTPAHSANVRSGLSVGAGTDAPSGRLIQPMGLISGSSPESGRRTEVVFRVETNDREQGCACGPKRTPGSRRGRQGHNRGQIKIGQLADPRCVGWTINVDDDRSCGHHVGLTLPRRRNGARCGDSRISSRPLPRQLRMVARQLIRRLSESTEAVAAAVAGPGCTTCSGPPHVPRCAFSYA